MRLQNWIYRKASLRTLIIAIMVVIPFNLLVFPVLSARFATLTNGLQTLDVQIGYLPSTAQAQVAQYSGDAIRHYLLTEWTADLIFPLAYTTVLTCILAVFLRVTTTETDPLRRIALLPLLMMASDYAENILVSLLVLSFPNGSNFTSLAAAVASATKWVLVFTSLLLILYSGIRLVVHIITARNNTGEKE